MSHAIHGDGIREISLVAMKLMLSSCRCNRPQSMTIDERMVHILNNQATDRATVLCPRSHDTSSERCHQMTY